MNEFSDLERLAMRRALLIAMGGLYSTGENPRVGACFIRDGEILSEGFHRGPGLPHAEIEAIRGVAPSLLQGSTCVVTLEPCSHIGKTGPCVDALIDAGEPALRIVATLTGQIRGWLWVSLMEQQGERDVAVIAKAAGIGNPKRIYVMRKQLQGRPPQRFLSLLGRLLEVEARLKRGAQPGDAFRDGLRG